MVFKRRIENTDFVASEITLEGNCRLEGPSVNCTMQFVYFTVSCCDSVTNV